MQPEQYYTSDDYIDTHPNLHEEDSAWKFAKILPFVHQSISTIEKETITILDVGGGAGVILQLVGKYIEQELGKKVEKHCLDLSPGMLDVQKKHNPSATIQEGDIRSTPYKDKEMDLVLMIDVLEHVPEPEQALKEIKRISHFALFKVPLEDSLYYKTADLITRGKFRERLIKYVGHINVYNVKSLKTQLRTHCGDVALANLTRVYWYLLSQKGSAFNKLFNVCGWLVCLISPSLAAKLFNDYLIALVDCDA